MDRPCSGAASSTGPHHLLLVDSTAAVEVVGCMGAQMCGQSHATESICPEDSGSSTVALQIAGPRPPPRVKAPIPATILAREKAAPAPLFPRKHTAGIAFRELFPACTSACTPVCMLAYMPACTSAHNSWHTPNQHPLSTISYDMGYITCMRVSHRKQFSLGWHLHIYPKLVRGNLFVVIPARNSF